METNEITIENNTKEDVKNKTKNKNKSIGSFQTLGLSSNVFRGIMAMGYKIPTPIQRKALPIVLSGRDVVAMARTGSGKTAAFLIPMIEKLKEHSSKIGIRGLILSPTRELAIQTIKFTKSMAKFTNLKASIIVGGDSMEEQFESIASSPDIVVATPGRLMHHLQEIPNFTLRTVEYVAFDEADRIFEMGFANQLHEILNKISVERQTVLFSATLPSVLVQFARAGLSDPELIRLDVENQISDQLKMAFITVRSNEKPSILLYFLRDFIPRTEQTIVFVATRHHVEFLHELLKANKIDSSCIYGEMDQVSRNVNISKFRLQKTNILIVTDVAARGIDIPLLNNVINYSFPSTPKLFIHRVGRAARAGKSGTAFSFLDPDEVSYMFDLHLYLGRSMNDLNPMIIRNDKDGNQIAIPSYTLETMTVNDVHYGCVPQEIIDSESESLKEILDYNSQVAPLVKVCNNAYKQYCRSRADPSKQSIKRAKEICMTSLHPLFRSFYSGDNKEIENKNKYVQNNIKNFRPTQTIFELTRNKNKFTSKGKINNSDSTIDIINIMKDKRQLHQKIIQIERNEKVKLNEVIMNSSSTNDDGKKTSNNEIKNMIDMMYSSTENNGKEKNESIGKRKISKAERRKAKKAKVILNASSLPSKDKENQSSNQSSSKFRDEENYIGYMKDDDKVKENILIKSSEGGKYDSFAKDRLEEAILDVYPDEAIKLNNNRRLLQWDTRKRKYIKTTVGELNNHQGKLRRKNESGNNINSKKKIGEFYRKWQQKSNKQVGSFGDTEEIDEKPKKMDYRNAKLPSKTKAKTKDNRIIKNELKSETAIKKELKRKARSEGNKNANSKKAVCKRGKGNIKGKSHGAPTRSKAILRKKKF